HGDTHHRHEDTRGGKRSSIPDPPSGAGDVREGVRTDSENAGVSGDVVFHLRVARLIDAYRSWGHLAARLDPLGSLRPRPPELRPSYHGLTEGDLRRPVGTLPGLTVDPGTTVGQLVERLESIYCGPVGLEYTHVVDGAARHWLQDRFENRTLLS